MSIKKMIIPYYGNAENRSPSEKGDLSIQAFGYSDDMYLELKTDEGDRITVARSDLVRILRATQDETGDGID